MSLFSSTVQRLRADGHLWIAPLLLIVCSLLLVGCEQTPQAYFFNDIHYSKEHHQVSYQGVHRLSLVITDFEKSIDEAGFAPLLKTHLKLKNKQEGPWPQAWVAFNIQILLNEEPLAEIAKASVMQNHEFEVQFQHSLPQFGLNSNDIQIEITPIAWMPTYPLEIYPEPDLAIKTAPTPSQSEQSPSLTQSRL